MAVVPNHMRLRRNEFERIRSVIAAADVDGPLTAREILQLMEDHDADVDNPHQIATVLGRRAETGEVEVIRDRPYRYRIEERGT